MCQDLDAWSSNQLLLLSMMIKQLSLLFPAHLSVRVSVTIVLP
jgi:hypothetical protein